MTNPPADPHSASPSAIRETAAAWVLRTQSPECTDEERHACEAWLATSSEHRREFETLAEMWGGLDHLLPGLRSRIRQQQKRRRINIIAGLSVAIATFGWLSLGFEERYVTAVGERTRIELADGSSLELNTNTAVRVTQSLWSRKVNLEHGEALFDVTHELRGFTVTAAGTSIRDIGTRFIVRADERKAFVAVLDGAVEVQEQNGVRITLNAGQATDLDKPQQPASLSAQTNATDWLYDRMEFRNTPLSAVLDESNRYYTRPIVASDPVAANLRISGVFRTKDRAGLIRSLVSLFGLEVDEKEDRTVLHATQKR